MGEWMMSETVRLTRIVLLCLSIYRSICLCVYLSIYLSICSSDYLSVYFYVSIRLPVYICVCLLV